MIGAKPQFPLVNKHEQAIILFLYSNYFHDMHCCENKHYSAGYRYDRQLIHEYGMQNRFTLSDKQ